MAPRIDAAPPTDWLQSELPLERGQGIWWMGFTPEHTDEEARAKFVAKYHRQPKTIRRDDAGVYAGPVEDTHENETSNR